MCASNRAVLSFACVQMSHRCIGGSCNRYFFSISSLLGSQGPGNAAIGRIWGSMLERELPGAERPLGSQHLLVVVVPQDVSQVHLRFHWNRQSAQCQHSSCLDPALQFEVVSSHHVSWRCLLGVSMAIHSTSRGKHTCSSAQMPTNTCATYRTLEWRNRSLCRIHAIFIFIHEDATISGVGVLGGSEDLAG